MKLLNSCCCCATLETGGKIIAILGIVGSIIQLVNGAFGSEYVNGSERAAGIVSNIFGLCVAACLLYGIIKNKHRYILAWLIIVVVQAVIGTVILIYGLATVRTEKDQDKTLLVVITCIAFLIAYAIGIYLWLVIYALYVKIRDQSIERPNQPGQYNTNYANAPNAVKYPNNPNAAPYQINTNVV